MAKTTTTTVEEQPSRPHQDAITSSIDGCCCCCCCYCCNTTTNDTSGASNMSSQRVVPPSVPPNVPQRVRSLPTPQIQSLAEWSIAVSSSVRSHLMQTSLSSSSIQQQRTTSLPVIASLAQTEEGGGAPSSASASAKTNTTTGTHAVAIRSDTNCGDDDYWQALKVPPATTVVRWNPPLRRILCLGEAEKEEDGNKNTDFSSHCSNSKPMGTNNNKQQAMQTLQRHLQTWVDQHYHQQQQQRQHNCHANNSNNDSSRNSSNTNSNTNTNSTICSERVVITVTEYEYVRDAVCIQTTTLATPAAAALAMPSTGTAVTTTTPGTTFAGAATPTQHQQQLSSSTHSSNNNNIPSNASPSSSFSGLYSCRIPPPPHVLLQQQQLTHGVQQPTVPSLHNAPSIPTCSSIHKTVEKWRSTAGWPCAVSKNTNKDTGTENQKDNDDDESSFTYYKVVIVDRYCGEAILRGSLVYKPGVVCTDVPLHKDTLVAVYADMGPISTSNTTTGTVTTTTTTMASERLIHNPQQQQQQPPYQRQSSSLLTRGMRLVQYRNRTAVLMGVGVMACDRNDIFAAQQSSKGLAVTMLWTAGPPNLPPLNNLFLSLSTTSSCYLQRHWFMQNLPSITVPIALLFNDCKAHAAALKDDNNIGLFDEDEDLPFMIPDDANDEAFTVLDMCCAPGGKTSHLVSLLFRAPSHRTSSQTFDAKRRNDSGNPDTGAALQKPVSSQRRPILLVACDKSRRKVLQAQRETWDRLGCSPFITALALDTTHAVLPLFDSHTENRRCCTTVADVRESTKCSTRLFIPSFLNAALQNLNSVSLVLQLPVC